MAEKQLNSAQVARASVDQCRLGSAHGVRGVLARIEANAADPFPNEAEPSSGQMLVGPATPWEQALAWLPATGVKIVVDRLAGYLSQPEANGSTRIQRRRSATRNGEMRAIPITA